MAEQSVLQDVQEDLKQIEKKLDHLEEELRETEERMKEKGLVPETMRKTANWSELPHLPGLG
jgi:hypothetical protein